MIIINLECLTITVNCRRRTRAPTRTTTTERPAERPEGALGWAGGQWAGGAVRAGATAANYSRMIKYQRGNERDLRNVGGRVGTEHANSGQPLTERRKGAECALWPHGAEPMGAGAGLRTAPNIRRKEADKHLMKENVKGGAMRN